MPQPSGHPALPGPAVDAVRRLWARPPRVGLVLGSGLGTVASLVDVEVAISSGEIPGYPRSTAMGHRGGLLCGFLGGVPAVVLDGRVHSYEGHPFDSVAWPVRLLLALGIETLLLTNASGAVNPDYSVGDMMVIDDHINLMWGNPLIGPNDDAVGPRFPDLARPYDPELSQTAFDAARSADLTIHRGVYLALAGPNYETRAEYRLARRLGADVVGMSTVPEVLTAVHAGCRVMALSVVSNVFNESPDHETAPVTGELVLAKVSEVAPQVAGILSRVIASHCSEPAQP